MKKLCLGLIIPLTALVALWAAPAFAGRADRPHALPPDTKEGPGVMLSWQPPAKVPADKVAGYNIYRSQEILGHYEKVNKRLVAELKYEDRGLKKGKDYYYKVTTVFAGGTESPPTKPVGMTAGAVDGSPEIRLPGIEFFTSDALGKVTYLGEEAVFILNGDPGLKATFDIPGLAEGLPMQELKPGSYKGAFKVKEGMKVKDVGATATLMDGRGGKAVKKTPDTLCFTGVRKPSFAGLYAGIVESDRVGLNWPKAADPEGFYSVYRDTSRIVGTEDMAPVSGNISKGVSAYIDKDVMAGQTYYYVLAVFDRRGRQVDASENLEVKVPGPGRVSGIETVEEDSGGKTLGAGDKLSVTMKTSPGGKAFFSLGAAVRDMEMAEAEPGVYKGGYLVREGDGEFKVRVTSSFKDAAGASHFANSATFVSVNAPRGKITSKPGGKKPVIHEIRDNIQTVMGVSGRLTAGKTFTVTITGDPGNKAFFNVGDGIWKAPMKEEEGNPGVYSGEYTVRPGDNSGMSPDPLKAVYVTGYLESARGTLSDPASTPAPVVIDTTCDIKVDLSATSLPADARSQSKVIFTVTDADGQPVVNRRLTVMIEPPPRYTGVVGGGGMNPFGQDPAKDGVYGRLQLDYDDLTDSQGRVTATYTAGFSAKTAMIVARDFVSGSAGMGFITTGISSSVSITLEEPVPGGPPVAAPPPVYQLVIEVQPDPSNPVRNYPGFLMDAVPDVLTADGVSRANVTATLTQNGAPVEGKTIVFGVSGAGGGLNKSSAVTDSLGRAQVFYIAGTKAGKALVTATESSTGITTTKVITLLADAPARIYVKAYPDKLPADGVSTSRVVVELADVNNNPTDGVGVKFSFPGGSDKGFISMQGAVTDFRGACDFIYTAGTAPGVVTVDITAMSEAPTEEELKSAYARVVAPMVYDNSDFTETVVLKWLKSAGDPVGRGEPLAVVGTPLGQMTVYSPVAGVLDRIVVDQGLNVMEGKEIGIMR